MRQPDKWRDTIDPYTLKFNDFKLKEVLGYPHAGNDVFYVRGNYKENEVYAFIKVARQKGANIKNEVELFTQLELDNIPVVLDYDKYSYLYIVTKEIEGDRLSTIVGDNKRNESLKYMEEMGANLAILHSMDVVCNDVVDRKFFHIPSEEYCCNNDIEFVLAYLNKNKPTIINKCFCHGDYHYANILWKDNHIVGILDFELAGIGNKEFDIAWSLIRRPNQKFMNTEMEFDLFIKGYMKNGICDVVKVRYYMVLIYSYFYTIGKDDKYKEYVYEWLVNECENK